MNTELFLLTWQEFVEGAKTFFNQPVPVIGCTIGALCIAILTIISRTSIGKKALKKLTNLFNESKNKVDNVYNEYQNFKKEKEQEIKDIKELYEEQKRAIKEEYENKLAIVKSDYNKLNDFAISIGENIHNKNITKLIGEYKDKATNEIVGISEVVDKEVENARITYKEQFEQEIKAISENYAKVIEELKNEIMALKEEVKVNVQTETESVLNGLLDTKETILQDNESGE